MHVGKKVAVVAIGVTLVGAGSALAAHPRKGRIYAGDTSASAYNGFKPIASFTVSASGGKLLNFLYQSFGCGGIGGPTKPGVDYFLRPYAEHKLGSITVKSNGTFTLKNRKTAYTVQGYKTVTTSTVSGHFKSRDKAVGEITFSQKDTGHGTNSGCGPAKVSFTASLRPS